jgi:hypothetical protein
VTDTIVGNVQVRNLGKLNISSYNSTLGINPSLTIMGDLNKTGTGVFSTGINSTIVFAGTGNSTIYSILSSLILYLEHKLKKDWICFLFQQCLVN